jgi:iron complex outermembrane receptor protein
MTKNAILRPIRTRRAATLALFICLLPLVTGQLSFAADAPRLSFDVPAGDAGQTLKQFAQQAKREIMFPAEPVGTVKTNAVKGDFPVREALDQLLAGTALRFYEDEKSGALIIRRDVDPNAPRAAQATPSDRPANSNEVAPGTAPVRSNSGLAAPTTDRDGAVLLSPFEVRTDKDYGYIATNTLAGSRLNSAIADTPATIQVMTKDFLKDIGAVNVTQAMEYAVASGNDIGSGNVGGTTGNSLIEQDYNFMIRGYHNVQLTRDFFPTTIDGDAFNLERIDISRGPNSILFGVGGAGGIVNITPKQAEVGQNIAEGLFRVGSYRSYREAVDVNRTLLDRKLAVRLNLMNQDAGGYQDFVTDNQKRAALALTWKPTESTTIRVSAEVGKLHQNRARPWLPFEQVANWKDNGSFYFPYGTTQYGGSVTDNIYTQWNAFLPGAGGPSNPLRTAGYITGTTPYVTDGPIAGHVLWAGTSGQAARYYRTSFGYGVSGFNSALNMADGSVPRTLNISGTGSFVEKKYNTLGATIDQKLAKNLYLELVVNRSSMDQRNQIPMGFSSIALMKDVTTTLPSFNADRSYDATGPQPGQGRGQLNFNTIISNPYVGQYMAFYNPSYNLHKLVNDDVRLQLAYQFDFGKWAGKHNLLGFASRSKATREEEDFSERNVDPNRPTGPNSRYDSGLNFSGRISHIDPFSGSLSERGVPNPWTHPIPSGPIYGDPAHGFTDGWIAGGWSKNTSTIDTVAVAMQSKFLSDNLVTTVGIRRDKLDINNYDGHQDAMGVALAPTLSTTGVVNESATTHTIGAVYNLPFLRGVGVFANKSTNFQDQPGNVLFGDQGRQSPVGPIKGDGQDIGLRFDFFGGRLSATLDYFKVNQANAASGFDGNVYNYISAIWKTIANNGPNGSLTDTHQADGSDTSSQLSKGGELEVTANPTKNWRVSFNISKDTNVVSALDTQVLAYINANLAEWQAKSGLSYDVTQSPGVLGNNTIGALIAGVQGLIAVDKQNEGQIETNQRRWNSNLFTAYTFDRGPLKGLVVGGGVNYRGAEVLGQNPTTHQMFTGSSYYTANGLLGYQFKLKKVDVKVQLNVQNLFDYTNQQVLASSWNPAAGNLTKFYYYILPRSYSVTTTVSF